VQDLHISDYRSYYKKHVESTSLTCDIILVLSLLKQITVSSQAADKTEYVNHRLPYKLFQLTPNMSIKKLLNIF
jgi:hypothetical protein